MDISCDIINKPKYTCSTENDNVTTTITGENEQKITLSDQNTRFPHNIPSCCACEKTVISNFCC
jgi:hypothetical protein